MWPENDRNVAWYGDIRLFFLLLDVKNIHFTLRWEVVEHVEVDVKKKGNVPASPQQQQSWEIPIPFWGPEKKVQTLFIYSPFG